MDVGIDNSDELQLKLKIRKIKNGRKQTAFAQHNQSFKLVGL